jgi:hypothetical protein
MIPLRPSGMIVAILLTGLLFAGSGCVKIDATVNVERDGSGSLRAIYGMPTHIIKQAELARQLSASLDLAAGITNPVSPDLDIPFLYDEAILKTRFAAMAKEGVILESLKTREQGGWKYVDFTLKFTTLEALVRQSLFRECGVVVKRLDESSCKLTVTLPPIGSSPDIAAVVTQESLSKLAPFFNGFRVVTRVTVPGAIRNTNSLISDLRRATWEWDFDKDSSALVRFARDKMVMVFDVSEARITEFEKPAGTGLLIKK